jgi:4-hydroxyphenylacetate 3-monooxygenase
MTRNKAEDFTASDRPFTGREYLESLRDGREIYIYGERVDDVTTPSSMIRSTIPRPRRR